MLKTLSESFDKAQDERTPFDIIEDFPFMLRLSKHSESFSATCWSFAPSSTTSLLRFY